MPTTRRALVVLGLPISSSPACQLAWTKCLTGCGQIAYSCILRRQRSSAWSSTTRRQNHLPSVAPSVVLSDTKRTTWCLRQLFVTSPGNSHRQRCRYAVSSVAYGVGMFCCLTTAPQHQTFSVRFCSMCRWLCHISTTATATQYSQDFLRPSSVDFSRCSTPPPD